MLDPVVHYTVTEGIDRGRRSELGRRMLQQAIVQLVGSRAEEYHIAAEPSGRPVVTTGNGEPAGLFVSLSHTGMRLACAATALGPIGIDIEEAKPNRDLRGIAAFAFGPAERQRHGDEGAAGFYRIWTLREAISKANGAGLSLVADRSDRAAAGPAEGDWRDGDWIFSHQRISANSYLSIALLPTMPVSGNVTWLRYTDWPIAGLGDTFLR